MTSLTLSLRRGDDRFFCRYLGDDEYVVQGDDFQLSFLSRAAAALFLERSLGGRSSATLVMSDEKNPEQAWRKGVVLLRDDVDGDVDELLLLLRDGR